MDIDTYEDTIPYEEGQPTPEQEREMAEQDEIRWQKEAEALYAEYVADCEQDGDTPLTFTEWDNEEREALIAELEWRAEGR
jgi:hypothetical protein